MKARISVPGGMKLCKEHAIYCRDDDALAIADLHLGYEASLQAEHVAIPRFQLGPMKERLDSLLRDFRPERVIINGDMKHDFSRNMGQEWDEVEEVLDIFEGLEVTVVRGNHDNYLQTILSQRSIKMVDSLTLGGGNITFMHGHRRHDPAPGLRIYGHEHPVIRFRDEVGAQMALPCFLHDEANGFLVMPAFSPLASGTNVLSLEKAFMCPDLKDLDISQARVYAIHDGILDLGMVEDLRTFQGDGVPGGMKHNNRRG